MKSRSYLVIILVLSLAVVPGLQLALAASSSSSTTTTTTSTTSTSSAPKSPYSERLDIYTAGSSGYSLVSLSPVNASKPSIVAAESVAGVSAYQLTAIKTASATPGSELFWVDGYNVLKLPFVPTNGVFLNVTASSKEAAQSAATSFDSFLGTNLVQISSSGNNYTFFGPADFTVAGETIFTSVPGALEKGLASTTSGSTLATTPTPTAILTGVRSGSAFTHTVTFGSTQSSVVSANGSVSLAKALNQANATFTSSARATSTQVVIHALDGLISSGDGAKVTNSQASFSGTYTATVPPNTKFKPNVTILADPPVLTATRILDRGSAASGDLVSVTVQMRNTAQAGTIQNIAMNDSWWNSYPGIFTKTAGNSSFTIASLSAGQNVSRTYVLKVNSAASQDLTIPSAKVSYSYSVGGVTVSTSTTTNQVELRTNSVGPALMILAGADIASGSPIGRQGHYVVTVTNLGNGPALNLQVAGFNNPTLSQGGQAWKVNTTIPLTSIVGRNQIDQLQLQCFLIAVRLGRTDGIFSRLHIAPPARHVGAEKRGCVVLQLLLHDVVELGPDHHRMRRACIAAGSHGRYVGGLEQEKSRRSSPATRGGDINDDRDRRGDHLAYHLPHGIEQSARSVHLNEHGIRMLRRRSLQAPRHVVGADGLDRVVEVDDDDAWLLCLTGERPAAGQHQHTQQAFHGTD